jgi:TonB family protein
MMKNRTLITCIGISLFVHVMMTFGCLSMQRSTIPKIETLQVMLVKLDLPAAVVTDKPVTILGKEKPLAKKSATVPEKPNTSPVKKISKIQIKTEKKLTSIHKPMDVQPETIQDVPDTLSGYDSEVADWANRQELVEESPGAVSPPQEIETADGLSNQENADFVAEGLESAYQTTAFPGPILFSSALAAEGNAPPVYPRIARRRGWEGKVWLIAEVNKNGFVQAVELEKSSGHGLLDQAAFEAVSSWKFKPQYLDARRIKCEIKIPIRFELHEG